jgi:hypothetical protein
MDPKLVLAWLLGALGGPAWAIGLLVPIREAGALLPQLVTAARIRALPQRKWAWSVGSAVQGAAVAGMGVVALTLRDHAAALAILALLAVFALARSVCSVAYKDVLGKTVSKSTRGTATGSASTLSAAIVLVFGLLLASGLLNRTIEVIAVVLFLAGGLWLLAAALFSTLAEARGATGGGGNPLRVARAQIALLGDAQLRRFIATRGLLTATALAPPWLLALAGRDDAADIGTLGLFVVAASAAALLSNFVWGRLADISSRRVLILTAVIGMLVLGAAAILGWAGNGVLDNRFALPTLLFLLMIAYQGVRLGRSTHLVDMADADTRAAYTALANTFIGLLLLAAGGLGALASLGGAAAVLSVFAAMCALAVPCALGLEDVQARG